MQPRLHGDDDQIEVVSGRRFFQLIDHQWNAYGHPLVALRSWLMGYQLFFWGFAWHSILWRFASQAALTSALSICLKLYNSMPAPILLGM